MVKAAAIAAALLFFSLWFIVLIAKPDCDIGASE